MPARPKRKRATAIVEYPEGILLALMRYMAAALPGGGVKPGETDHVENIETNVIKDKADALCPQRKPWRRNAHFVSASPESALARAEKGFSMRFAALP